MAWGQALPEETSSGETKSSTLQLKKDLSDSELDSFHVKNCIGFRVGVEAFLSVYIFRLGSGSVIFKCSLLRNVSFTLTVSICLHPCISCVANRYTKPSGKRERNVANFAWLDWPFSILQDCRGLLERLIYKVNQLVSTYT